MIRITSVESMILLDRYQVVRVHTSEGVSGLGVVNSIDVQVTHAFVTNSLAPLVVGRSPLDIERLWHEMYHKLYKLGPTGAQLISMAGIDIALWDIAGKLASLPVHALLGGTFRPEPAVYASSMKRGLKPQEEAERAIGFKEQGYHGYKIHSATSWMYDDGFDDTVEAVRAIRDAVGDDFPIMVDVNNAYLAHTAIRIARQLEELGVWHFEEPLADHDRGGYAALTAAVNIPIAAGEQEYTRWQFRDLILYDHIDILQPDVTKCGGFTEFKKIAAVCQAFSKPITVHNVDPIIGTAAHLHLWTSTPNCIYPQEYNVDSTALTELAFVAEPPRVRQGRIVVPDRPGLGLDVDEAALARLRTA